MIISITEKQTNKRYKISDCTKGRHFKINVGIFWVNQANSPLDAYDTGWNNVINIYNCLWEAETGDRISVYFLKQEIRSQNIIELQLTLISSVLQEQLTQIVVKDIRKQVTLVTQNGLLFNKNCKHPCLGKNTQLYEQSLRKQTTKQYFWKKRSRIM